MASNETGTARKDQRIRELAVQNFGCLRDTEVSFAPFTVLVGPNDSGKSLILRALERLSVGVKGASAVFSHGDFTLATFNRNDHPITFTVRGTAASCDYDYHVAFARKGNDIAILTEEMQLCAGIERDLFHFDVIRKGNDLQSHYATEGKSTQGGFPRAENAADLIIGKQMLARCSQSGGFFDNHDRSQAPFEALHSGIKGAVPFRLDTNRIREAVPIGYVPGSGIIDPDGFGVAKAVAELLIHRREIIPRVEEALRRAMPFVRGVHARHVGNKYALEVETLGGVRVDSSLISDGVLLFLGYLLLVMGPDPTPILLIEEPEIGIHPGLLEKVVGFLRGLAYGDPPVQVIITTHSPILLNFVEPEEIRVVERQEDGGTKVFPFQDTPDLQRLLQYQGPGEIWVNLREEYITRGQPQG